MNSTKLIGRLTAEAFGTFILVSASLGTVVANDLSGGAVGLVGMALGPGLAVMTMIYVIGSYSGAHMNPAVTFGFVLRRDLSVPVGLAYVISQLIGATAAAGILRSLVGLVGDLGATLPSGSFAQSLGMEVLLTFVLVFIIAGVVTNPQRVGRLSGLVIGGTVTMNILIGGPISGAAMNPARAFAPALLGWHWSAHWIYWVGPIVGACIGILCFYVLGRATSMDDQE